jgi:hypothetical protein
MGVFFQCQNQYQATKSHQPCLNGGPPNAQILPQEEHLNFMLAWMVGQKELSDDDPDHDLLGDLLRSKGDSGHKDMQDSIMQYMEEYEH